MDFIAESVIKQLGFDAIWSMVQPYSVLGRHQKQNFRPYTCLEGALITRQYLFLEQMLPAVRENVSNLAQVRHILESIKDIGGTLERSNRVTLDEIDLYEVKLFLVLLRQLCSHCDEIGWMSLLNTQFDLFAKLLEHLHKGQQNIYHFFLADGYDSQLAEVRGRKRQLEHQIVEYKKQIRTPYEVSLGYMVADEITVSKNEDKIIEKLQHDPHYALIQESFASMTFAQRSTTHQVQLEEELGKLKMIEDTYKHRIRQQLTDHISRYAEGLHKALVAVGELDLLFAKARLAHQLQGCRPQIIQGNKIEISEGRHPLVAERLEEMGLSFTPITIKLKQGATLITGSNMGGKTVTLKLIGLLATMVHYGLYVPAKAMQYSLRTFIYYSVNSDTLETGLSKFGQEVLYLRDAMLKKDTPGLVLIDEIAQGTNPDEGSALAQAIVETLHKASCIAVFTTHFTRLIGQTQAAHWRVKGLDHEKLEQLGDVLISKDGVNLLNHCMNYQVEQVIVKQEIARDAIKVAELLGFCPVIIKRAKALYGALDK